MTHSVTTVGRGATATTRSPVRRLSAGFLREVAERQRARDIDPSPLFLLVNITENGTHVSTIDPETAAVVADRRDRVRRPAQRDVAAMCHTAELTAPGHVGSVVLSAGHDSSPDLVATIEAQTELPVLVVEPRSPHAGGGALPTSTPTQTPPDRVTDPSSDRPAKKRQWFAKPRVALGIVAVCAVIGVGTALVFAAVIAVFAGDDVENPDGLSAFVGDEQTSAPADPAGGADNDPVPKQSDPVNPGQVDPTQLDAARRPAAQYVQPPPPEPTWSATDPTPGGPPAQRRTPGAPAPPPPPVPAPAPIPAPPPPQQRTIPNPIPGLPPIVVPF